jgi:hypothetical protein
MSGPADTQIGLIVDPCFRKGIKAAWRPPPVLFRPPITEIADTDLTKKSETNSSLLPMLSYQVPPAGFTSIAPTPMTQVSEEVKEQNQDDGRRGGRGVSEMDIMAAVTLISPEQMEEARPPAPVAQEPVSLRRGGRMEVNDSVL